MIFLTLRDSMHPHRIKYHENPRQNPVGLAYLDGNKNTNCAKPRYD